MAAVAAAAALLSGAPLGVPRAEAFIGLGDILGGAANAASKASAVRAGYLDAGDNPVLQDELYKKELGDAAREVDPEAVRSRRMYLPSSSKRETMSCATTLFPSA